MDMDHDDTNDENDQDDSNTSDEFKPETSNEPPVLNIDAIDKTIELLLSFDADADKVRMATWIEKRDAEQPYHGGVPQGWCNTVGCCAGWVACANLAEHVIPLLEDNRFMAARDVAEGHSCEVLGLTFDQRNDLFLMNSCGGYRLYRIRGDGYVTSVPLSPTAFDETLSPMLRRAALINVLHILKYEGAVDWPRGIARALSEEGVKTIIVGI